MGGYDGRVVGDGGGVGQDVWAPMKPRDAARRRRVPYHAEGVAPPPGAPIPAGDTAIGVWGWRVGDGGLAMIRFDGLAEARARDAAPVAEGVALIFDEKFG